MNKLGISNEFDIENIERKIVEYKMSILDSRFTFNEKIIGLEYLRKLHNFLFGDIYFTAGNFSKRVDEEVIKIAEKIMFDIYSLLEYINYEEVKLEINKKLEELINLQLFDDGNHRVVSGYFKLIIEPYIKDNKVKEYCIRR